MNKTTGVIAVVIATIVVIAGALFATGVFNTARPTDDASTQTPTTSTDTPSEPTGTDTQTGQASQATSVDIKNFAFSPAVIKVKKGTTVTWTNQDSVGHNVVATDKNNTGGLPMTAPLLKKGQSVSHTFTTVGTFEYVCAPHPNMKATVEVTD